MASPLVTSVDWGDVVTTTLENRSRKIADNLTNNNALFSRLKMKGNNKPFTGGREITQELSYAANGTFQWYSGFEPVNVALNDTMTAARYTIKQCAVAVTISGLEEIQNDGDEKMIDLIGARTSVAESTFENAMSVGLYSDGTGFGGKQIGGLQLLISKTPTVGTVGGIDAAANTFWRNFIANSATDPIGAFSATTVPFYFNKMTLNLKRNSNGVDLIVADNNIYDFYLRSLQNIQRITDSGSSMQGAGFTSLKYYGAGKSVDVVLDGGKNGQIPASTAYFVDTDYLFYRPASTRNFTVIRGERSNVNQDAIVRLMGWAGNLTCSNRSLQGVLF